MTDLTPFAHGHIAFETGCNMALSGENVLEHASVVVFFDLSMEAKSSHFAGDPRDGVVR